MPNVPFLIRATGPREEHHPTVPMPSMPADMEQSSTVPAESISPGFVKPYSEQFGPERWQDAVAAATRDMISDLATHTPAQALRT